MHEATERFVQRLHNLGMTARVREYPHGTRSAQDAANAIGVSIEQIVKSILFDCQGSYVLVLISGNRSVDVDKLRAILGCMPSIASPKDVKRITGSSIGGVAPFGHPAPVRTLIDEGVLRTALVWVAAGTPLSVAEISTQDLVRATGSEAMSIALVDQER